MLPAQHDDDDDIYIYIYKQTPPPTNIYMYYVLFCTVKQESGIIPSGQKSHSTMNI